ncbi:unnamed protein product [Aureobasidium uvarum]|uniref:Myb-like domain-containing protein n=1 Tax=Aureobasidium uvarum TaxID=2773716 RepID=A0A9N8PRW1_9PEZI|nr:unnamed protein product [Aureobasidium uvarum]
MDSPLLSFADFDSPLPASWHEVRHYDDLDTGLGEGFDFDNPWRHFLPLPPLTMRLSRPTTPGNLPGFDDLCPSHWWGRAMSPASAEPVRLRPLGCDCEVEASDSEDEVLLDETDSEDELRPMQMAAKRPVGAFGPAGSGDDEEERPASGGDPIAEAPEGQQELEEDENEEFEDDDDEYAPARPVRRAAGGKQPSRVSAAPAPIISSRKASTWSLAEDAACIKFMKEVCTLAGYAAIAATEKRFEVVADRMKREAGFNRTASGVKLQWNRRLRAASGFEDRGEKKRASGLTTSALPGQSTKRGTSAVTSLVASTPSNGKESSATPASSIETSFGRRQNNKRKANSDDEDDDDFISAPLPSKPAKRVRSTSVVSSSAVPSTQDHAYYALSTENILSGPRSSRHRRDPAPTITAPPPSARSSRQKPITTTSDDDDEEEVIQPPKQPARPSQQKRARSINNDEDDEQSTAAPSPKRKRFSNDDKQPTSEPQSKKEKRIDLGEWYDPRQHYTRKASPEPAPTKSPDPGPTKKAYWLKILADRQARAAIEREERERQRQAQEQEAQDDEDDEEDEDPIVNPADRTRKNRELRRQFPLDSNRNNNNNNNNNNNTAGIDFESDLIVTSDAAAQIAADEEMARQMEEEWNEEPAPRARRGRGFN